jgi:hypothetical protein
MSFVFQLHQLVVPNLLIRLLLLELLFPLFHQKSDVLQDFLLDYPSYVHLHHPFSQLVLHQKQMNVVDDHIVDD